MVEQGTPEWHSERAGRFTGSKFCDVMARNKKDGKPLKAYHDLIWQLVVERMTKQQEMGLDSYALRWGKEVEPFARDAYERQTGYFVEQVGFIVHPKYDFVGASPDGLIEDVGGLEMKAPKNSGIHLERYIEGVPEEYIPQIQGGLWVTGRKWWSFVSYDPRMPPSHRLLIINVERDEPYISKLEASVLEAEELVQQRLKLIMERAQ